MNRRVCRSSANKSGQEKGRRLLPGEILPSTTMSECCICAVYADAHLLLHFSNAAEVMVRLWINCLKTMFVLWSKQHCQTFVHSIAVRCYMLHAKVTSWLATGWLEGITVVRFTRTKAFVLVALALFASWFCFSSYYKKIHSELLRRYATWLKRSEARREEKLAEAK